ncbi:hypothetical protein O7599_35345 [Streptomyces sp. WMMC500]|uniref:hypothetical protein n=1 Tax=Streptomyces sp. WMMC500 TaxID=3015154 RepID=UPI00248C7CFA|nr:hypothetical protein [Streptomyces sp. WMMC500]WBB60715.1 hypothetical protein O7599_35345 [Streptomyces sp. WMMC500]
MRIITTVLAAAAVGALAAGLTATVATAQDNDSNITSFGFSVTPKTVKPGGTVDLTVTECRQEATASSAVFDKTTLGTGGGTQSAQVKVDLDAKPGAVFDVTFTCGNESGTAPLTIAAAGGDGSAVAATSRPGKEPGKEAAPGQSARPAQPGKEGKEGKEAAQPVRPAEPVKPTRPARGGLGGSQEESVAMLSGGAGLTAAGAFGGALLLRRREAPGRD